MANVQPKDETQDEPIVGSDPLARRNAAFDDISKGRREQLRADDVEVEEPETEETPPVETDTKPDTKEGEDAETPVETEPSPDTTETPPAAAAPEPVMREVTVDGEKRMVSEDDLVKGYQIEQTARQRLEQANRMLSDLQRQQEEFNQQRTATPAAEPTTADTAAAEPSADQFGDLDVSGFIQAVQFGEAEEAETKLKELVSGLRKQGGGTAAVPQDDLEARVLDRIEWTQALKEFGNPADQGGFKDILEDDYLASMAGSRTNQLWQDAIQNSQQTGAPRPPYWDILKQAGDDTRAWIGKMRGGSEAPSERPNGGNGAEEPTIEVSGDRTTVKRTSPQPPVPKAAPAEAKASQTKETPPLSQQERASASIAEMRKSRGQA